MHVKTTTGIQRAYDRAQIALEIHHMRYGQESEILAMYKNLGAVDQVVRDYRACLKEFADLHKAVSMILPCV